MKKRETKLNLLNKEQQWDSKDKLKEYLENNLDCEISGLQADIFVDFISENLGIHYYNKGVADSLTFMTDKVDELYLLMKE